MAHGWVFMGERNSVRMKHDSTRFLFNYWNRLRGDRPAPDRREIEPADIGRVLSSTFILEAEREDVYGYRLAGTKVCSAYGCELKGTDWLAGWAPRDREALATMMGSIVSEGAGAILGFYGRNARQQRVPLESLLLPLAHADGRFSRVLGLTVALDAPYWLGALPIVETALTSVSPIWPSNTGPVSWRGRGEYASPEQGLPLRRMGHLALYDGGRPD